MDGNINNEKKDVDFKKVKDNTLEFVKKHYLVLLLLIPIFLSIFFRAYPIYLPITDDWAEQTVHNSIKQNLQGNINQQYPNLPQANKEKLINDQFDVALKEQEQQIQQQIDSTSQYFKSRMQTDDGQTYLLAIDPWLWYGEVRNYIAYGQFGNTIKDGKPWYDLRNGRIGKEVESFNNKGSSIVNQYAGVYLYKLLYLFNKETTIMGSFFLLPLIIITLSVIPAFFIAKHFGGNIAGVFSGIIVAVNSALLGRTPAGFSDTDSYNIFFSLFIAWVLLLAIINKDKKSFIYSSICGLLVGLYSIAWSGWAYSFIFVLGGLCFGIGADILLKHKETIMFKIKVLGTFLISSSIFVIMFNNLRTYIDGITSLLLFIKLKDVAVNTFWPNVMTTVAEFNTAPLSEIITQMGGNLMFLISIIGIVFMGVQEYRNKNNNYTYSSFLLIWFFGTAYAFTKGIRFSILMVPVFAIAFGIGIGIIYKYLNGYISDSLKVNKLLSCIIIIGLLSTILITPIMVANQVAKSEVPSMNDGWYDSLIKIKNDNKDAIITSWWDFGHFFVAVAERKVTFDGADQGRRIHFVGKSLLVDEEESVAILKMLNCGQNTGPFLLEDYLEGDTARATDIINKIIMVNKEDAIIILKEEGLTNEQIVNLTKLTHCDDIIPQYFITSQDMVGKAGVWGHFGAWDFHKATIYQTIKKLNYEDGIKTLDEEFNITENNAEEIYYDIKSTDADRWISPWPSYQGVVGSVVIDNMVSCNNGVLINLDNYNVTIYTNDGVKQPTSLVYTTDDDLVEKQFTENTMPVSIALVPTDNGYPDYGYNCVVMDPLLAKSTFTRLFYFDGHGSKYFDLFSDTTTFNGQRIMVWKVDFTGENKTIMTELSK